VAIYLQIKYIVLRDRAAVATETFSTMPFTRKRCYSIDDLAGLLTCSIVERLPEPYGQWHDVSTTYTELTATGIVQDLHLIPF